MLRKYYIALLTIFIISSFAFAENIQKPSKSAEEAIKETGIAIGKKGKEVGKIIGRDMKIIGQETRKVIKKIGEEFKDIAKGETKK